MVRAVGHHARARRVGGALDRAHGHGALLHARTLGLPDFHAVDLRVSFSKGTKLPLIEVVLCFQFAELALASLVYCCCAAGAAGDVGPVEVLEHEPLH